MSSLRLLRANELYEDIKRHLRQLESVWKVKLLEVEGNIARRDTVSPLEDIKMHQRAMEQIRNDIASLKHMLDEPDTGTDDVGSA